MLQALSSASGSLDRETLANCVPDLRSWVLNRLKAALGSLSALYREDVTPLVQLYDVFEGTFLENLENQ